MRVLAYVYSGWHPTAERDASFHPGFTEWELVESAKPRFGGHAQPRLPLFGRYDDRDPAEVARRLRLALEHGVDGFVHGCFWCRGKRVFREALDRGFLGSELGSSAPFAVMWANRMPRRVLPVKRSDPHLIDPARRVSSDVEDFTRFILTMAREYFVRPNYLRVRGRCLFSIFDTTFFVRELGLEGARVAIGQARQALSSGGFPGLHLLAIDPQPGLLAELSQLGFDGITHYVHLPDWKGPLLQDYETRAAACAATWASFRDGSGLPHHPSVSPGWDASPRGEDFGTTRPDRYPWSPVVVGERPDAFRRAVARAARFVRESALPVDEQLLFVASLNEWSEGHYLEPDTRFGTGWLEAVREGRKAGDPSRGAAV